MLSNAAHHAPAGPIEIDDIIRVAGRVHALVRRRPTLAETRPQRDHVVAARPAYPTYAL